MHCENWVFSPISTYFCAPFQLGSIMQSTDSAMRQAAPYLLLGTQMAATVIVLGGIGWWIDSIASTEPVILIIGASVGSVVGLVQFLRSVQRLGDKEKQRKLDQNERE